ncbi:hypothetical protein JXA80_09720, partial [bacterium]|nr:hypothetical protein [candidate division CSSED10-310 bacterium]
MKRARVVCFSLIWLSLLFSAGMPGMAAEGWVPGEIRAVSIWPNDIEPPFAVPADPASPGVIQLVSASFDPLVAVPELPSSLRWTSPEFNPFQLVQFSGPISEQDIGRLRDAGAEPLVYLAHFTFICRLHSSVAINSVRDLLCVRWIGSFEPAYRIDPLVGQTPLTRHSRIIDPMLHLTVTVFPGESLDPLEAKVIGLGGEITDRVNTAERRSLRIRLEPGAVIELAHCEEVYRIEEEG